MIENVHERELAVPVGAAATVIDDIGDPRRSVWPSPPWPGLRLDRALGEGADGGHGPIRYTCARHVPGREVSFRFHPSTGLRGTHTLSLLDGPDPQRCLLRHVLRGEPTGVWTTLRWGLVIRWLHDALLEDLLDRAAAAVGTPPARPARWSPWVRLLAAVVLPGDRPAPAPRTSSPA